jgi:two-component system sensor histidine kinase GlrK
VSLRIPTSILQLTLIGFLTVSLPLIAALVFAVLQVDGLAGEGRRVVLDTAQAVRASRIIVEQVSAMERSAQQYRVLRDQSFYLHYVNRRAEFESAISVLSELELDEAQRQNLDQLISIERELYQSLKQVTQAENGAGLEIAEISPMLELARSLSFEVSQFIAGDADEMRRQAKRAKRLLAFIAVALIPATIILALVFTVLITKPLRRIDQEIRRLGSGEFTQPISMVGGPQDLRELSIRLDWLRMRLHELEEQKKSFLRSISHELKTPLSAIREAVELLKDGVVGTLTEDQLEVAAILRDNSIQLQKRIEDLLKFNLASSQPSHLRLSQFRIDELIRRVISDHRLSSRSKHLVIEAKLSKLEIGADKEKVKMIVDNLFSNAVKFSPMNARIVVGLTVNNGVIQLDVQDEGSGIEPKERDKVFEAFYQGRVPNKSHVKGTGLGLAIVKEYVNAHRGAITILDQEKGTHMRVLLPLEQNKDHKNE